MRCDHITCGRGYFRIRKEKVADSKISGYVWTGRKAFEEIWMKQFTQNSLPITFTSYEPNSKAKNKTYLQS